MRNGLLALFILALAGVGVALITSATSRGEAEAVAAGASPLEADYNYYIQDMRATRFGSDGQAVSQLSAEQVTHYPDGDRAELQAPGFKAHGAANDGWQVSAATGTLVPDAERMEDRLDLQGNVELHQARPAGNFIAVSTSALTVYTGTEEVVSTAAVALRTRDSDLQGIGIRALLAEDYIQLNDSNGSHDPKPLP